VLMMRSACCKRWEAMCEDLEALARNAVSKRTERFK
jgi:hypothetical protein